MYEIQDAQFWQKCIVNKIMFCKQHEYSLLQAYMQKNFYAHLKLKHIIFGTKICIICFADAWQYLVRFLSVNTYWGDCPSLAIPSYLFFHFIRRSKIFNYYKTKLQSRLQYFLQNFMSKIQRSTHKIANKTSLMQLL